MCIEGDDFCGILKIGVMVELVEKERGKGNR
jgi:hypothetical protein